MSDISKSSLGETFDADFEAKVAACSTAAEISELMKNRSVAIGLTRRDIYSPDVLVPVEPGTQPRRFAKAVVINGVKHLLEAPDEAGLLAAENALFRQQLQPATTAEHTDPARDERGRFTVDDPVARIESDLVTRALQQSGIDPDVLREFSNKKIEQSWQDATTEFLQSPAGAWWPGGSENVQQIGTALIELGLTDNPSVESLRKAAEFLRDNDRIAENPELIQRQKIANANSPEEIREALGRSSTSLFGR